MKRVCAVLLMIAVVLSCSGCLSLSKELSQRGIVAAIGIDFSAGKYKITLLILNADQASSEQNSYDVDYIRAENEDLHQAFVAANRSTAKDLFYGHNSILIFGRDLMEQRLKETMLYLAQSKETRLNVNVFMVEEKAEDFITTKTSNKAHLSGTLDKMLTINYNGIDIGVQLFELLCHFEESGVSGVLPVLGKEEIESSLSAGEDAEKIYDIRVQKFMLLDQNRLAGMVEGELLQGILLLLNRVDALDLMIADRNGDRYYAQALQPGAKISYDAKNRTVTVRARAAISITGKSGDGAEMEIGALKEKFEQEIRNRLEGAMVYCEQILDIDLFGLSWYVRQNSTFSEAERLLGNPGELPVMTVCEVTISG